MLARFYRLILRCYPAGFRGRFGRDMEDLFRDRVVADLRNGRAAGLRTAARLMLDAVHHGLDERRAHRKSKRTDMLRGLTDDLRHAARTFAKRPGFTTVALLTLTLGIGANTAIFSIVHAALMRDLPFADPDRIVRVYETNRRYGFNRGVANPFNYDEWEKRTPSFAHLAAMRGMSQTLTGAGEPERVRVQAVTAPFFDVMGVQPALGQPFSAAQADAEEAVAMISYTLWKSRFGSDPSILGRPITLNGKSWHVAGVMPPGFSFPHDTEVWQPFALTPTIRSDMRSWYLGVVARLKPDASIASAQAELDAISAQLEAQYPRQRANRGAFVIALHEDLVSRVSDGLKLLQGVVVLVLLIACANVANLLLAQAAARERELAIRAAIGAGRARLIRQLLVESLLLATVGAALGSVLAVWGVKALVSMSPLTLPEGMTVGVSGPALVFTAGLASVTGLIFGIVPAFVASGGNAIDTLRDGGRGASPARTAWLRSGLVAAEVALAVVLLAGAGLLVRSFTKLMSQEIGFRDEGLLTAHINLPTSSYATDAARAPFWSTLFERLEQIPGVTAVAGSTALPFSNWEWQTAFTIEGRENVPNDGVSIRTITSGYFATLGIPVIAGREFSGADVSTSEPALIVNEAFVRRHLEGLAPVGQRVNTSRRSAPASWATIVGVVGSARHYRMEEDAQPEVYRPLSQAPAGMMTLALRTDGDPEVLAPALRSILTGIDSNLPLEQVSTMQGLIAKSVATRRFYMSLLAIFAAVALALAACGIYGVTSFSVAQRVREFAIRLALGARPDRLKRLVFIQGLRPIAIGIAIGVPVALALIRLLRSQLFLVSSRDPLTLMIVCAVLVAAGVGACWLPARRTSRVDPLELLRSE